LPTFLKFENANKSDICVSFAKIMDGHETEGLWKKEAKEKRNIKKKKSRRRRSRRRKRRKRGKQRDFHINRTSISQQRILLHVRLFENFPFHSSDDSIPLSVRLPTQRFSG